MPWQTCAWRLLLLWRRKIPRWQGDFYCSGIYSFYLKERGEWEPSLEMMRSKVCIDILWLGMRALPLCAFWVPTCISWHISLGVRVQHSWQTIHRVEPDCPEARVPLSLAPEGHAHHTHQFSSQEANAHPSPWHLHVLHHWQVLGEFFLDCLTVILEALITIGKSRENQHLLSWRVLWQTSALVVQISSFAWLWRRS